MTLLDKRAQADPSEPHPLPSLSLAERDRRYRLVRKAMSADAIDLLILPASTTRWEQSMADSRYLTTIGGFGTEALTIFPLVGEVTTYVFNRASFWRKAQDWVSDVRDGRNDWAGNIIERLGELRMSKGRVGIAGLSGLTRSPDGIVPYETVARLRRAHPGLDLVNATALMRDARAIKSDEEITVIERATAIAEAMAGTVGRARPGDTEKRIYRRLVSTLLDHDGELPAMIIIGSGPDLEHGNFVPTERPLQAGDIVSGEIEGRYAGYSGQIVRAAVLGAASSSYRDLHEAGVAAFDDVLASMADGATIGDVAGAYEAAVKRHAGPQAGTAYPLMHGRGLGDEVPAVITAEDRKHQAGFVLHAGMTFVLKPRIMRAGVPTIQVGDMVVVGQNGGRRLGRDALALREVPWVTS